MFQFLNFNCWNLEQFSFPYFLANQVLCKWSLDKMHRWWWATGSVSAGSRLATGDCKCSDLMFHHPMSSVEAGRGFVMAPGRVGGSEGWEPLNTNPFGSPGVDALLWRLPVHSVEKNAKNWHTRCARRTRRTWGWLSKKIPIDKPNEETEETLKKLWGNSEKTLRKLWGNSEETLKKLWRNS